MHIAHENAFPRIRIGPMLQHLLIEAGLIKNNQQPLNVDNLSVKDSIIIGRLQEGK